MTGGGRQRTLWIGTYPVAGQGAQTGSGEGIWRTLLDLDTGTLSDTRQAAITPAPSYLAWGPGGVLYAVNEELDGGLTAWRRNAGSLEPLGHSATQGTHPCHLHVHAETSTVVVTNYSSGSVAVIRLDANGVPEEGAPHLLRFEGSGPHPDRQESSHPHYVVSVPDQPYLLVSDLGADCVRRLRPAPHRELLADDGVAVRLPAGAGPRHAAFSADGRWLYLVGELDGRVHTISWDAATGTGQVVASVPAEPGWSGPAHLAHIASADGRLWIGGRDHGRILTHRIGDDGLPRYAGDLPLPGRWPRHHALVGDWLVVAQQEGGGVAALDRDGAVRGTAEVPSPACILPEPPTPTYEEDQ
ncbi:MAG: lactonase family protein [Actinobacteria bacterium]|nr:lactonase family protein [Actinomycetota bacterium]